MILLRGTYSIWFGLTCIVAFQSDKESDFWDPMFIAESDQEGFCKGRIWSDVGVNDFALWKEIVFFFKLLNIKLSFYTLVKGLKKLLFELQT